MKDPLAIEAWSQGPRWIRAGRIPCLDGLRGVAISLVILAHALGTKGFPLSRSSSLWEPLNLLGPLGVSIFFVLSGFLITLLLLRERARIADVSISKFYLRRALRIVPAYLAYLGVVYVGCLGGLIVPAPRDWALALTYTASILPPLRWEFVHLWSLSIEEQFYVVWPILFVVLGTRRAIGAAVTCVAATLACRVVILVWFNEYAWWIDYFTFSRLDCIAIGCLLALATTDDRFVRGSRKAGSRTLAVGVALLIVWYALSTPSLAEPLLRALGVVLPSSLTLVIEVVKNAVVGLLVGLVIWSVANRPESLLGRALEWRPLMALGAMSYSMYLWQQFFLNWDATGWVFAWPLNLLFVALAAAGSYLLIERPFLRLKTRLESSRAADVIQPVPFGSTVIPSGRAS